MERKILIKDHSLGDRCPLCKRLPKKYIRSNQELNGFMAKKLEAANMQAEIETSRPQLLDSDIPNPRVPNLSIQESGRLIETEEIDGDIIKKLRGYTGNQNIDSDSWSDPESHLPPRFGRVICEDPVDTARKVKKKEVSSDDSPERELSPIRIPIKLKKKNKHKPIKRDSSTSSSSNSELQWLNLERRP